MKRLFQIAVLLLIAAGSISAQLPKREVRSSWITTTWGQSMDWPAITVPAATASNEAAREKARETQKSGLIEILDKLKASNFNTVYFQVRGMCDAFYKSKYEPWSQWISEKRGDDPGWDPLKFAIDEAHKRGMELHAWLNPYRYSTAVSSHGNLDIDYFKTNPSWLMDYGNYVKILNPGMPEVVQRISDVVADIITNYDVDGIVFDDYFYVSGTTTAMDQTQYNAYNPTGLSRADWRRANVNKMIKTVYERILSIKPHVSFGVSPAGVTCRTQARADKFGVELCPSGSDWQYDSIYSDPLAWIYEGSIDYISPQVYWSIGSGSDYAKIAPWWSKVTNKLGRHFFSSNTSHDGGSNTASRFSTSEILAQLRILRGSDISNTSGAVHFRYKTYFPTTYDAFVEEPYQFPALTALYGWKQAPAQTLVDNLAVTGQNLTWTYANSNVRFAIYAVPTANRNDADAFTSPKYLQGVSYTKNFTLSDKIKTSTHKIAVVVYDRFGNVYSPRVLGESSATLTAAQLVYPANNQANMDIPTLFSWNSNGADYYVWQLASDAAFTKPIASREVKTTNFSSALQSNIKTNTTYYWRVKSIKANAPVTVSEVRAFNSARFSSVKVTSPANGATVSTLTPALAWTPITGAMYKLEVSPQLNFDNVIYTTSGSTFSATVPSGLLKMSSTYYVRVKAELDGRQFISEPMYFATTYVPLDPIAVPTMTSPTNGASVPGTEIKVTWKEQRSRGFRVEMSQDISFPPRATTPKTTTASVYSVVYDKLAKGIYYIRMTALMDDEKQTAPTSVVKVDLTGQSAIPDVEVLKSCYAYYDAAGNCYIAINDDTSLSANIDIYSVTGVLLDKQVHRLNVGENTVSLDMTNYANGIYLIRVNTGSIEKTIKVRK